jgi:dipeptidyl-peptidase III
MSSLEIGMELRTSALILLFASLVIPATAQTKSSKTAAPKPKTAGEVVDRVGNTGFVQIHAESFRSLSPQEKELAYWLTQAAIAIDPIIYDQLSWYGLRQKRLLEEVISRPQGIDPAAMKKITDFAKLFWGNRGNHNDLTAQKFLPDFTFDELQAAALQAQKNGAFKSPYADLQPLATPDALSKELGELEASLFDPNFQPMTTAKSPQVGKDIIESSANSFYGPGVTLADLKDFKAKYGQNSRVVKGPDGKLTEQVYRAGTPDGSVPPGLYATYLKRTNEYLAKAQAVADPQQAAVIAALIRYYQTGEYDDLIKFDTLWVQNNAKIDFANNFIEIYRDANGMKASSQAFVSVTDKPLTTKMEKLAHNAEYFEAKAPWDAKYKKTAFVPPTVKAIETIVETGDFSVTTIGDNLPNENAIHEQYGTKNYLFTGSSRALTAAAGTKSIHEFDPNPAAIQRSIKYGQQADELLTALHEVIGHGSGKLSEKLNGGAEPYLKEYFSTLEEARADLSAYWNVWDPKLKELGLIEGDQEEIAKTMYDSAALVVLTQLRRIPHGDSIEEDHQRDRALIANYIMEKTGAIRMFDRDGKTYVEVTDYPKMKQGVGMLLTELMRIKAEGDYAAIKALVDKYGVHFDPKLRDQVVARYKALNIPTYWAGVNAQLNATMANGKVKTVEMTYPRNAVHQYLYYGSMYAPDVKVPAAISTSAPATKSAAKKAAPQKDAVQPK